MADNDYFDSLPPFESEEQTSFSRRDFITGTSLAITSLVATGAALSPLLDAKEIPSGDEILQKHYKQLTLDDKKEIFARLEAEIRSSHHVTTTISDPQPMDGVEFAYVLNVGRCIGCRKCVYACMKENNTSRDPEVQYIRVLKISQGSIDLETSSHDYPVKHAAQAGYYYMPVQCHQCRKPPCIKVCPVKATWMDKDGIIVVDHNWCIGCRYCEAACPYHARRFNFSKPTIAPEDINPDMGYLSNRIRPLGTMEKCTFCLHRTRVGKYPACHDACPTGARKFGNLRDPKSEVRKILEKERVYVLKQEVGTLPRFYYVFAK
jgi:molybdopterin-containing oxidoreductase family iron-sulfur binding subunit